MIYALCLLGGVLLGGIAVFCWLAWAFTDVFNR